MQRLLSVALTLCLSLTVSVEAQAKRLGGGKSSGDAPIHNTQQRQATSPSSSGASPSGGFGLAPSSKPATAPSSTPSTAPGLTPNAAPASAPATAPSALPNSANNMPMSAAQNQGLANTAAAAAKPSGMSRWLGPLAGFAAGGLLASMLFGGGAGAGIASVIFDLLLIALLIGGVFFAVRFFMRKKAGNPIAATPTPAYAGAQSYQAPQPTSAIPEVKLPENSNSLFSSLNAPAMQAPSAPARELDAPAWFNEQRFVDQGREHFMSLQQYWDMNEMDKIAEFVTPAFLQQLKQERAALGAGFQSTLIENLQVYLDGVSQQHGKTIATLTFEGVTKSSRFEHGEAFSESWRMERNEGENQPWLLAGIHQNQ